MYKIYVSIPITGRNLSDVGKHIQSAISKNMNNKCFKNKLIQWIDPISVGAGTYDKPYEWYMGEDIRELLKCDAILFCKGWWKSKGCKLEMAAALIYGKKIYFE